VIALPVPEWLAIIIVILGIVFWVYDLAVLKPRRHRERSARKREL
jgi:hypothetical protein